MPKNDKRVKITLECTDCKRRNYITMKSKINDRERLETDGRGFESLLPCPDPIRRSGRPHAREEVS
jgi:hypothetical protein